MVVKTNNTSNSIKYCLQKIAGRNIIERRPEFSPDGESLALIVENIVRVYNVRTGEIVRTLETENHVEELIAIEFPQNEDYNLVGCSTDGRITTWTWDNGAVLREINLHIPPETKIVTFNLINNNECFITATGGPHYTKNIHIGAFSIKTGYLLQEYNGCKMFNTSMIKVAMGWCNNDRYAAIINGTKILYIQSVYQPHIFNIIINVGEFRITSVAAHQHYNALSITDTLGHVTVIRGNLYDKTTVAKEVLHWHFLPPLAVCFSLQGNYLYTGGMEAVLVKWTLGNLAYKANEKAFIPRLPGLVRYITTNNTHIAITLSNNSVVLANAQMRIISTILECGGVSPIVRAIGSTFLYHHQFGALLMHTRSGHLQLYSTTSNKVLYSIDITRTNTMQPERWNLLPLETEVTCANISRNGTILVTSEYRNDGITYPEEKLKFWSIQQMNQNTPFKLNTCVNLSHGGCRVVSIALNSNGDMCVSAGKDQKFRIWKLEKAQKGSSWFCLTACYYSSGSSQALTQKMLNDFKLSKSEYSYTLPYMKDFVKDNDVIMKVLNMHKDNNLVDDESLSSGVTSSENDLGGAAISQDGSLVAAWFGCKLTLWDTNICNIRTTLSHPALRPKGLHVEFGNQDAAHYLVCTTENCLAVWSLLSLTIKWLVQIEPVCLATDGLSNKMAVVTKNNDVFVFTPHTSVPILMQKSIADTKKGVFKQCTFGASPAGTTRLYLMRNDTEIYTLKPELTEESRLEIISHRSAPVSKFSALMAEQQLSEVRPAVPGSMPSSGTDASASAAVAQISQAPPHMLPPISLLSTSFLQELSGQLQPEEEEDTAQEDPKHVQDSSDDDEADDTKPNGPYTPKLTELWTPNYDAVKEKKLKRIINEPFLDLHACGFLFGLQ